MPNHSPCSRHGRGCSRSVIMIQKVNVRRSDDKINLQLWPPSSSLAHGCNRQQRLAMYLRCCSWLRCSLDTRHPPTARSHVWMNERMNEWIAVSHTAECPTAPRRAVWQVITGLSALGASGGRAREDGQLGSATRRAYHGAAAVTLPDRRWRLLLLLLLLTTTICPGMWSRHISLLCS